MRRDLAYRSGLLREIAGRGFSVVVQAGFNRDLLIEDALVRASGAHLRIGSVGTSMFMSPLARRIGDRWYTRLVTASPATLHELDRNAEFLRQLGSGNAAPAPSPLEMGHPAEAAYALFVVSASSPLKSWPLANFQHVANSIAAATGLKFLLCAAPGDAVALPAAYTAGDPPGIRRTSLEELIDLIRGARLVVCNDSAASHLSAVLRIPCVCVLGGGILRRYHPYPQDHAFALAPLPVALEQAMPCFDCGWRCRYDLEPGQAAPCVAGIAPERVLAAALSLLQQPPAVGAAASRSS